jgi:hypothetical protein
LVLSRGKTGRTAGPEPTVGDRRRAVAVSARNATK